MIQRMGINFSDIWIKIYLFEFNKIHVKVSCAKWRLFRLGRKEFITKQFNKPYILF